MNKSIRKLTALAVLLAAGTLFFAYPCSAEAPKPALTISFAGYDQLLSDLKTLDQLSGHAKLASKFEAQIKEQTQGKGLAGLDKSRPWGVLVSLGEGDEPVVQGFIPVTDLKQLLGLIPMAGALQPNANGIYEIPAGPGKTVYFKQKGAWAIFADSEKALDSLPDDPSPAVADLAKRFLVSIRGSVQNIPEASRQKGLAMIHNLMEAFLSVRPASDEERASQTTVVKQFFAKLEKFGKDVDTLDIGIGLDTASRAAMLDFELRSVAGSSLAKKIASLNEAKTDFAGFALPGAAITMLSAGTADDDDVANAKATLASFKSSAEKILDENKALDNEGQPGEKRTLAKKLLADLLEVAEKTIELKKSEVGMSVVLGDAPATIVGLRIADGAKLNNTFKELVKGLTADKPDLAGFITMDAEKYEGVNFHVVKIPIPDPSTRAVLGDTLQIAIGTSESGLYLGAGKDPIATIKKAIDASKAAPGKAIDPLSLVVSAEPIVKFFAKVIPANKRGAEARDKKNFAQAAARLAKSAGKDHITLTVKAIPDGELLRLNIESGVTKAILDQASGWEETDDN